ncbi:MAG TPA: DUF2182 domain-containing protein [Acidimicrobiales bacterium]|nr:DUF2182 domain-containing protein [Acidimicrobiales bacterium]
MEHPPIGLTAVSAGVRNSTMAAKLAVAAVLAIAVVCWVSAIHQMHAMSMGPGLGSLGFFIGMWATMMAAMMLPGAIPVVLYRTHTQGARVIPLFLAVYLAVWTVVGLVAYALDRPHSALVGGVVTIAAGFYELTPLKRHFRRRCHETLGSGLGFGLDCVGSTIGLMAMLVALGVMSVTWMVVVAVVIVAQKLLPAKASLDVPTSLAMIGLGVVIALAPSAVPGLMPAM